MASVELIRKAQKADGPAAVLAIGLANPPNSIQQSDYADFLFRVTGNEDKVEAKEKYDRICKETMIKKRHFYHTEELLKEHPNLCELTAPSLNARHDIVITEVPKLGKQAAEKAIEEWGQPKSHITHVVFCTTAGVDMPSADFRLAKLLGLSRNVSRHCVYMQGCHAGGTGLRLAKDLAENNRGSRVLLVCSELSIIGFRAPDTSNLDGAGFNGLFGDGASALIVGSDPIAGVEKPIFELAYAKQTLLPDCEDSVGLHLGEDGLTFHVSDDKMSTTAVANLVKDGLGSAFAQLGVNSEDWNSMFWIVHSDGRDAAELVEERMELGPEKLRASRRVFSEYGNMMSASVFFVMDEMRRRSAMEGRGTTGEGDDWGVLLGFGPGVTLETVIMRSVRI